MTDPDDPVAIAAQLNAAALALAAGRLDAWQTEKLAESARQVAQAIAAIRRFPLANADEPIAAVRLGGDGG